MLGTEEDEFEAPLRAEVERLRQLAKAWEQRTPPTALDSRQKERWQRDAWIAAAGFRDAALRLEDACNVIAERSAFQTLVRLAKT
jgi:hypothetical protein